MFDSIRSRIAAAVLIVGVAAGAVTFAIGYVGSNANSDSSREEYKRIILHTPIYRTGETTTFNLTYAKMQDIRTNSATYFLNPFGKSMSSAFSSGSIDNNPNDRLTEDEKSDLVFDADLFEQYVLIRLPPELGGDEDRIDAFRAYSNLDPGSKCLLGYRTNQEGNGAILQDPCHSDIFRVSDGYSCYGKIVSGNPVLAAYNAIPRMKLSVDDQGYLLAAKPDGQPHGDGTVGEGRIIVAEEIKRFESDLTCEFILSNNR
jgi:hypothetical protein